MNPNQQPVNPISVMQKGEQVVVEIRRHPIGIITVYIVAGLVLAALAVIFFILAPNFLTTFTRSQVMNLGSVLYGFIALLTIAFLFIANIVYWGNRWVITTDSITQISQTSLFHTQSSQLSLGNLEDISAEQNGILTHIFNYGVLKVETAGERSKFQFIYCPRPTEFAQKVIAVREQFEQKIRANEESGENSAPPAPTAPQYTQPPQQPQA